ncbi:MAG: ribbon-helix-helix domain-containing protein [Beijerinckiaceae bacterium]
MSGIIKRSIMIAGHRTSISVEQDFWDQLKLLALHRNISIATMIAAIDQTRGQHNLSSAVRLHVLAALVEQKRQS